MAETKMSAKGTIITSTSVRIHTPGRTVWIMVLFLEGKSVSVSGMHWPVNWTENNILHVITDIDTRLTASSVAKKSQDTTQTRMSFTR